ncbi:MAG: DUF305 domain-containing protein [Sphingobacteriaceae bacterium]|nr:MAG: DUF305 domain-containing protein [Sphingobacteriaceae bacterium]
MEKSNYKKFYLMLLVSSVIMYVVMYLNVNDIDHVYFSLTRLYMTVLMITAMAVVMLLMMRQMYNNPRTNVIILSVSIGIFILALIGVHRQTFVGDRAYLKAMIPHHSIAIMTSENAHLQDPEVRRLADSIISAQKREISQMQRILKRTE